MDEDTLSHYLTDDPPVVVRLEIKPHFDALTDKQKHYAHHISIASFAGTRALYKQTSFESEHIHDLIVELHNHCKGDWKSLQQQTNVSAEEIRHFLNYAAQFLGNGGNFKSFGDTKFLPRISKQRFKTLATASPKATKFFEQAQHGIYGADSRASLMLGYPGMYRPATV